MEKNKIFALVDCNNFYVSCERIFQPKLEGKPVIVLSNNDGCVISRSNEAKKLGVKMGEPAFLIEEFLRQNNVTVFSSNYTLYGDISERVMSTLVQIAPEIEIYSIDEAFLDLTSFSLFNIFQIAQNIKNTVKKWTGIPVSVGIAPTKTLAKAANHIAKKNASYYGVCILLNPNEIHEAIKNYPVNDIWGVGRQYAKLLEKNNIKTAYDYSQTNEQWLKKNMTVAGLRTAFEIRGISCIEMELNPPTRKGICYARSFGKFTSDFEIIKEAAANFAARCAEKLRKEKLCANILTVFLETNRFKENEKQYNAYKAYNLPVATNFTPQIIHYTLEILTRIFKTGYNYKKVGVMLADLSPQQLIQQNIFCPANTAKQKQISELVDSINQREGRDFIRSAAQGFQQKWKLRQEKLSPCYTTRWSDFLTIKL